MSELSKEENIQAKLVKLLEQSAEADMDWASVTGESSVADLGLDSLSILDLLYDVEQDLGVRIESDEVAMIETLKDIVELIIKKGA